MAESRLRFSDGPGFSGALYFSDLVQSLKNPDCQALTKRRVRNHTRSATATRRNPKMAILSGGLGRRHVRNQALSLLGERFLRPGDSASMYLSRSNEFRTIVVLVSKKVTHDPPFNQACSPPRGDRQTTRPRR